MAEKGEEFSDDADVAFCITRLVALGLRSPEKMKQVHHVWL
jgi:hypothetical protein